MVKENEPVPKNVVKPSILVEWEGLYHNSV